MTAKKRKSKNKKRRPTKGNPSLRKGLPFEKTSHKLVRSRNSVSYHFNAALPFFNELRNLVLKISPPSFPRLEKSIRKIGRLKLAVATGVFLNLNNSRIDLLLIGDDIDYKKLNNFIKNLEAEMGLELRYVIMGTDEFVYRYNMFDRFTRDVLEAPHKKILNKIKGLVA
ncbi:MAG: hypothetical protein AAB911_00600 [Patescibacteria group bacterium]